MVQTQDKPCRVWPWLVYLDCRNFNLIINIANSPTGLLRCAPTTAIWYSWSCHYIGVLKLKYLVRWRKCMHHFIADLLYTIHYTLYTIHYTLYTIHSLHRAFIYSFIYSYYLFTYLLNYLLKFLFVYLLLLFITCCLYIFLLNIYLFTYLLIY